MYEKLSRFDYNKFYTKDLVKIFFVCLFVFKSMKDKIWENRDGYLVKFFLLMSQCSIGKNDFKWFLWLSLNFWDMIR